MYRRAERMQHQYCDNVCAVLHPALSISWCQFEHPKNLHHWTGSCCENLGSWPNVQAHPLPPGSTSRSNRDKLSIKYWRRATQCLLMVFWYFWYVALTYSHPWLDPWNSTIQHLIKLYTASIHHNVHLFKPPCEAALTGLRWCPSSTAPATAECSDCKIPRYTPALHCYTNPHHESKTGPEACVHPPPGSQAPKHKWYRTTPGLSQNQVCDRSVQASQGGGTRLTGQTANEGMVHFVPSTKFLFTVCTFW